jgi:hypothetical protein
MAFRQESPIKEHSKSDLNKNNDKETNNVNQDLPVQEILKLSRRNTTVVCETPFQMSFID